MASSLHNRGDRGVNTTNLYSSNPTIKQHVGPLLPIAELLRDLQAALSEARRIQEASRRRLPAQQAGITTKQLELLVEQIACALRVEVERLGAATDNSISGSSGRSRCTWRGVFPKLLSLRSRQHLTATTLRLSQPVRARDAAFCRFIEKLERQIVGAVPPTTAAACE